MPATRTLLNLLRAMILNRQRGVRVPIRKLQRFTAQASELLRLPADSLTVCLVSNTEIAGWNRAYRGKHGPTDVLSFPADPGRSRATGLESLGKQPTRRGSEKRGRASWPVADSKNSAAYLGDIAIAPSVARRNALRFGRSFEDEMRILILHGMLHLMGYDHETDSGQMDRRERRLRRSLHLE
jgi:probable rRNA maturation factor